MILVLREEDACLETFSLMRSDGLNEAQLFEMRDERRHAVIAQPARMEAWA